MELTKDWVIVARRKVIEAWSPKRPAFQNKVHFVAFEDWAKDFGEENFDKEVTTLLPKNFYRRWVEKG